MPSGVYKRTKPVWNKGVKTGPCPEHSKRMKGRASWNKGLKLSEIPKYKNMGFQKGHPTHVGVERGWFKKGVIPETCFKLNDPRITGKANSNWKGGVTPENQKIRNSIEYRLWRESVFARDGFTCVDCGKRGGVLNADHIKPFALFPELRFAIDNGQTLCVPCHKKTPSYMNRWIKKEDYDV